MLRHSNLPLQLKHKAAMKQPKHCSSQQQQYETGRLLISPIMTAETDERNNDQVISPDLNNYDDHENCEIRKYDLPCQRNCQQYDLQKYVENRPLIIKETIPQNIINCLAHCKQISASKNNNSSKLYSDHLISQSSEFDKNTNVRVRVDSIYQRLLQQSKRNKKEPCIATEATFKPKQLKNELSKYYAASCNEDYHQDQEKSPQFTQSKPIAQSHQHRSLSKQSEKDKQKQKSRTAINRKLNYRLQAELATNPKTKYQKILEQQFQTTQPTSRRQQTLTAEQVRLRKICGSNSSVFNMKLNQRLSQEKQRNNLINPIIYGTNASNNSRKQTQGLKQQLSKIQNSFKKVKNNKLDDRIVKRIQGKQNKQIKQNTKQCQNYQQKELKKCQTQRWMLLNFHERQQRVLSNRKQKQQLGKQMKIEKQIKPCTFKPALTKSKSLKTVHTQQMSYLNQYYQKLHRRY